MTLTKMAVILIAVAASAVAAGPELRIAVNMTTIESAPIFVAAGAGTVQLISGGIPLLVSGAADAATNAETQAILRSVASPNLRIILTVAECSYRVVARRSAGIRRAADLRGKRIGTAANTSSHYYLAKMLRTANMISVPMRFACVSGRTALRAFWCIMWKASIAVSQ